MTLKELEKAAATNTPMPEGLNAAEQLAFLSLRILYVQYALERIDLEQAKWEKVRIVKEYEQNALKLRSWQTAHEKERRLAPYLQQLNQGCKTCRQFHAILSGYKGEQGNDV